MRRLPLLFVFLILLGASATGQDVESEARAIEAMLVAPCCWSQQVSVHQSEAATSIKQEIRASLREGRTREQILGAYVSAYGPRILIEPPARGFAASLYVLPVIALVGSALLVGLIVRRFTKRGAAVAVPVSEPAAAPGDLLAERLDDELRDLD